MHAYPTIDVDLWADEVLDDPHPVFRRMRDLGPVVWVERYGLPAITRFDGVRTALSQWQLFSAARGVSVTDKANAIMGSTILTSDPPVHDGYRRPLAADLSVAALQSTAPDVEARAVDLVDDVVRAGTVDAVADLARPFSLHVVCDYVGIPDHERAALPHLAEGAFNVFGPGNERWPSGPAAMREFGAFSERMAAPGAVCPGTVGERMVADGRAGDFGVYGWPGIDTTVNAMSAAVLLFSQHPEQWDLVRADPSLIPSAFNEAMRLHSPVNFFTRVTTADVEVEGVPVAADTRIIVMYGSANRDERHYPDPDRFDVRRNPTDQLAFGRGIHLCVGLNLAKLEGHTLLAELARRVERFEPAGDPVWLRNNALHGLAALPVRLVPA